MFILKQCIFKFKQDVATEAAQFIYPDPEDFLRTKIPKFRPDNHHVVWETPAYIIKSCDEMRGKVFDNSSKC